MKQILCLSLSPWRNVPSRTQQLMSRMKGAQVLYFEPAAGRGDGLWRQGGRRVRPNVTVYTLPPVLTLEADGGVPVLQLGLKRLERFVAGQAERRRFRDFLLWTTSPVHVQLLDALPYGALVYDCDQDWSDLPELWEGRLAQSADVVFAASPGLMDRLSPCSGNLALLPNGVNYALFAEGGQTPPGPEPVFGWVGTIHRDLDLSPVLWAATLHPEWTFLLVGRQMDNPQLERLRQLGNVVLTGPRPFVELPDWLGRCHVCINLLRRDTPYSDVIPSRIFEYLSTGKPLVSMLWPDQVELFADVVYAAFSCQEFVRQCENALAEDRGWVSGRRRSYGEEAAWSNRAGMVRRILSTAGLV